MYKTTLCLVFLICFLPSVKAQSIQPVDNAYYLGYADFKLPLAWLVRSDLQPACDALMRGDTQTALTLFQQETATHPDDLAAYVGLIQAMPRPVRESYLAQYQKDAQEHSTAADQFKLGVLTWYLLGARLPEYGPKADADKKRLAQTTHAALQRAYDMTHAPVVGFSLASAGWLTENPNLPVYEDMLRHQGGPAVFSAYAHAKDSKWSGPSPPVPHMPRESLLVLYRVIAQITSVVGGQISLETTRVVNGKRIAVLQTEPYSVTQQRGLAFLRAWYRRIKDAAEQAG